MSPVRSKSENMGSFLVVLIEDYDTALGPGERRVEVLELCQEDRVGGGIEVEGSARHVSGRIGDAPCSLASFLYLVVHDTPCVGGGRVRKEIVKENVFEFQALGFRDGEHKGVIDWTCAVLPAAPPRGSGPPAMPPSPEYSKLTRSSCFERKIHLGSSGTELHSTPSSSESIIPDCNCG